MSMERFLEVFDIGLEQLEFVMIPQTLDRTSIYVYNQLAKPTISNMFTSWNERRHHATTSNCIKFNY